MSSRDNEYEKRYEGSHGQFENDGELEEGPIRSVEGYIIFVRNIHDESNEEDILDLFSDAGKVTQLKMPLDRRTGYIKGYALIEYAEKEEAQRAIEDLNGKMFRGKEISVDWAFYNKKSKYRS